MEAEWHAPMKAAISEVLETMFFEIIDFHGAPGHRSAEYLEARIDLLRRGNTLRLALLAVEPFARSLTSNFLSKPSGEVTLEDLEDMMKELANMIGGSFLAKTPEYDWELQIPAFISHASPGEGDPTELHLASQGRHVGVIIVQSPFA